MATELVVGVGYVSLLFRHAQSLKDKRQVLRSLSQKLKNSGFSVTECGYADDIKRGELGFTFAGHGIRYVQEQLDSAMFLFAGDYHVVTSKKDVFRYDELVKDDEFIAFTEGTEDS